jgi:excisionase family DNA binding protein
MENEQLEKLLSRSSAAELLSVSTETIKKLEGQGKLHPIRLSRNTVRLKYSELLSLIEASK